VTLPWFPIALAGVVAIAATVAIERLGGRLGGVLGTLPTTIVPASLGLAAVGSDASVRDALATVPVGMLLNAGFLYLWRVVPARLPDTTLTVRLAAMTAISLLAWAIGAFAVVQLEAPLTAVGLTPAWQGVIASAVLMGAGLVACRDLPPAPKGKRKVAIPTLLMRGALAAAAIATALILSQVAGPVAAGMASVFPAIFLTAMASLWLSQGEAVPLGAVGPMMLGSSAVSVYALIGAVTLPLLGAGGGATAAWVLSVVGISVPAAMLLARKRDGVPTSASPTATR